MTPSLLSKYVVFSPHARLHGSCAECVHALVLATSRPAPQSCQTRICHQRSRRIPPLWLTDAVPGTQLPAGALPAPPPLWLLCQFFRFPRLFSSVHCCSP